MADTDEVKARVFTHPIPNQQHYGEIPQFSMALGWVDVQARRVPWWAWGLLGYALGSGLAGTAWQYLSQDSKKTKT